jgi:hypothetical protein
MPPIIRPPAQKVKCNDPRIVKRFNASHLQHLIEHKLHQRAFALEIQALYPLAPMLQKEAEALDLLHMDGIKHADRQCRKLHMGGIPFSLEFKRMDATVGFWNALIHRKSGKQASSRFLQRLIKKAGIPDRLSFFSALTKDELIAKHKVAYQEYRTFVKQHSVTARVTWLEDLAEARVAEELKRKGQAPTGFRYRCFTKLKKGQTLLSKATDSYANFGIVNACAPRLGGLKQF